MDFEPRPIEQAIWLIQKQTQGTFTLYNRKGKLMSYNGWKNHATWNVALWIQNDEGLYNFAKECASYQDFASDMRAYFDSVETPDKVAWNDSALDIDRLDELITELASE